MAQTIKGYNKQGVDDVTMYLINLEDDSPSSKDAMVERLNTKYSDLRFIRSDQLLDEISEIDLIHKFNWAVSIIAAIAGVLGVANILILSVTERTREIGLLRALGWSRRRIVSMILQEGVAITVLGAIAGVGIGYLEMVGVIEFLEIAIVTARVDLELAGISVALAFVLGIIASIYPAWRASQLTPMDALRHE